MTKEQSKLELGAMRRLVDDLERARDRPEEQLLVLEAIRREVTRLLKELPPTTSRD